jgi:hypothetical protein
MRTVAGFIMTLIIVLAAFPSRASGDWRQFIPRIYDYSADLELNAIYTSDENTSQGRGLKTTDFFAREKINFYLTGYVYHPRFIVYSLKLGVGLKEENFKTTQSDSGWTTATSREYEFRTIILPEHPYNLELYTLRLEPLTRQALSTQASSVGFSKGAIFRYKDKPYFVNLSYVDTTTETSLSSFNTKSYHASATYFKEYRGGNILSFSGSYDHRNSTSSASSFEGSSDSASLSNRISLKNASIGSSLGYSSVEQGGAAVSVNNRVFSWTENVSAKLPWNFHTSITYNLSKGESKFEAPAAPETKTTTTTNNFSYDLSHRLYASLFTKYSFGYSSLSSNQGDNKIISNTLSVNYAKNIPRGRLMAGASYTISNNDRKGGASIINEQHTGVAVPGFFILNSQDVDLATLIILVRDPQPPFELVSLTEGVDYTIAVIGRTVRIDILTLPPRFPVPGTYDFFASYSLASRNVEFETTTISYNASLTLFEDLINPYYSHLSTKQRILSGSLGEDPFDEKADTMGLILSRRPFTLTGEYQKVSSNVTPYTAWRTELRYLQDITPTTQLQAAGRYSSTNYPQGTTLGGQAYTDKVLGADAGVLKRFPKRNISLSVRGFYSQKRGLSSSDTYGLTSSLTWTTRKLLVTMGATVNSTTTDFQEIKTKRMSQYYYLNVKRQLF